mmetsp:Transcript_100064/g.311791  ORF Transcript_100064/g.311791 Transcript_100064/m.311791 type:complete len:264 (-) Transcript_100064:791-1582(-)
MALAGLLEAGKVPSGEADPTEPAQAQQRQCSGGRRFRRAPRHRGAAGERRPRAPRLQGAGAVRRGLAARLRLHARVLCHGGRLPLAALHVEARGGAAGPPHACRRRVFGAHLPGRLDELRAVHPVRQHGAACRSGAGRRHGQGSGRCHRRLRHRRRALLHDLHRGLFFGHREGAADRPGTVPGDAHDRHLRGGGLALVLAAGLVRLMLRLRAQRQRHLPHGRRRGLQGALLLPRRKRPASDRSGGRSAGLGGLADKVVERRSV